MKAFFLILLVGISYSAIALEGDDLSLIEQYNLISSSIPVDDEDWTVNPSELDVDPFKFKNQERNVIDWNNLDEQEWLNIGIWIKERDFKDSFPNWRRRLREEKHSEIMGRVIKCLGVCSKYHETVRHSAEFRVMLAEGDEVFTNENSYLWIMLSDGSLLKLMPRTSVTLQEFNIGKTKNTVLLRLNQGQIHYQPRLTGEFVTLDKPESDLSMYPLRILEANREYFAIQEYRKMSDVEKLMNSIEKNPGHKSQYSELNKIHQLNNSKQPKKTEFFIFTPNMSLWGSESIVNLFYEPNGKAAFNIQDQIPGFKSIGASPNVTVGYRGYNNKFELKPEFNKWYEMNVNGTKLDLMSKNSKGYSYLSASLAFFERIPTIHMAREILFKEHIVPLMDPELGEEKLALEHGYRLWDSQRENELKDRAEFVKEYVRRTETTNLKTISHIFRNTPLVGYNFKYIARAMKDHYIKLKKRFKEANLVVREMNDTEYYIWLIKNGNK